MQTAGWLGRGLRECWLEARTLSRKEGPLGIRRETSRDSRSTSVLPGPAPGPPTDVSVTQPMKSGETVWDLPDDGRSWSQQPWAWFLCDLRSVPYPL